MTSFKLKCMPTERNTAYSSSKAPTGDSSLGLSGGGGEEKDSICWAIKTRPLIMIFFNAYLMWLHNY